MGDARVHVDERLSRCLSAGELSAFVSAIERPITRQSLCGETVWVKKVSERRNTT